MARIPTSELAAMAWIRTIDGFNYDMVSDKLTGDNALIAASGFVTVLVIGGSSDIYVPRRSPVIEVRTWACNLDGDRQDPPFAEAGSLIETIRERCLNHGKFRNSAIETEPGYEQVCVPSVYFLTDPTKHEDDDARFASWSAEVQFHWTRREE